MPIRAVALDLIARAAIEKIANGLKIICSFAALGVLQKIICCEIPRMQFQIKMDSRQVQTLFSGLKSQMPFAAAKMLTAVAGDVQKHMVSRLPQVFDRPTPFTQRGVFVKRAEKSTQRAEVYFPESQPAQGKATREYIRPGTQGASARSQKKTEFLLTRAGWLPAGWVTVPGRFIMEGKLDGFGNMPGSYYKQIIRNLQIKYNGIKPIPAASQKRAAKMAVENEFFAVSPGANKLAKGGGWLPPGVYKRTGPGGRKVLQYLKFVRKASYKMRLDVGLEAMVAVNANAQKRFDEAVQSIVDQFKAR